MIYFSYTIEDSQLLDVSEYRELLIYPFSLPYTVRYLEKHYLPSHLPDIYRKGIYEVGKQEPILYNNLTYGDINGVKLPSVSLQELEIYLETNDMLYIYVDGDKSPIFSRDRFVNNIHKFTEQSTVPLLTKSFIDMVLAKYMLEINSEHKFMSNDTSGISKHIRLISSRDVYLDVDSFYKTYSITNEHVKFEYNELCNEIIKVCKRYNPLSVKADIINTDVKLTFYASPASRRYNINESIYGVDDISAHEYD